MPTQPIHTLQAKHFALILTYTLAIALFVAIAIAQQLHQGVSVQMPITTSAQPMPAADDNDAWVVAITADGQFWFGTRQRTAEDLSEYMKVTPRRRDQNLYIKADARATYAAVEKVLDAAREGAFSAPVLLTAQHQHVPAGTMVSPTGLEVLLNRPTSRPEPVVVKVQAGAQSPTVAINNHQIPQASLQRRLEHLLQNQTEKVVTVEASVRLRFVQVVALIDICHAAGAEVILAAPEI